MLVTEKNFQKTVDWLAACSVPLTCDTETNYCQHQSERHIIGIAILGVQEDEVRTFYFPFRHEHEMRLQEGDENLKQKNLDELCNLIQNRKSIWHNGKFDIRQLAQEDPGSTHTWDNYFFYDTLILSHMENENKFSHELEELGKLVGEKKLGTELDAIAIGLGGEAPKHLKGKEAKEHLKSKGWSKIPPSVMGKYAEEDVVITWKLFKLFFPRVEAMGYFEEKEDYPSLYSREVEINHLIRKLEDRGVLIDTEKCREMFLKTQREMERLQGVLGFDPSKKAELAHRLYAAPSNGGLGFQPLAYSKLKSKEFSQGVPIMDEDTLARLLPNETVQTVIEWRKLMKASTTYYGPWLERSDATGRLHPSFQQHGTVTTRWTCKGPNLQQIPRS